MVRLIYTLYMNRTNWIIAILVGIAVVCTLITYAESQQAKPAAYVPPLSATTSVPASIPATPVAQKPAPMQYGTTTLAIGQKAQIADLTFTPLSVTDNRCPLGVFCITFGTVQVPVRITSASGSLTQTLTLSQPFTIGKDVLTLTGVQPIKRQHGEITPAEYQLTFTVKPAS